MVRDKVELACLDQGIFGEISFLLDNTGATASVIANETTKVYTLSGRFLAHLFESDHKLFYKFYKFIAASLALRLRATTKKRIDS